MTETSGYEDNWEGASKLAKAIYVALKYGRISAWVWWQLSDLPYSSQYAIMLEGVPTSRYYVSKNYYRYTRPGAVYI